MSKSSKTSKILSMHSKGWKKFVGETRRRIFFTGLLKNDEKFWHRFHMLMNNDDDDGNNNNDNDENNNDDDDNVFVDDNNNNIGNHNSHNCSCDNVDNNFG